MASERKFWFGLSISTPGCAENRTNRFVRADETQSIGDLVAQELETTTSEFQIDKIEASKSFIPNAALVQDCVVCENSMPAGVLYNDFGIRYIYARLKEKPSSSSSSTDLPNGLQYLMSMQRKYDRLPSQRTQNTAKDRLYNDVLKCLKDIGVGFTLTQLNSTGTRIIDTITEVLWYIDPFHKRLVERACPIPKPFSHLHSYREWKKQHKKEPRIAAGELKLQIDELATVLLLPWFLNDKFQNFKAIMDQLLTSLQKYYNFLISQQERSQTVHMSKEPVRSVNDNWSFQIVQSPASLTVLDKYSLLVAACQNLPYYEPVDLIDFEPADTIERRSWLKTLKLPFDYGIFTFQHGNYLGNLTVIWKQPPPEERDSTQDISIMNSIKSNMEKYATRSMRRDFIETYAKVTNDKPAILRSMYRYLTGYSFASENKAEEAVDFRVAKFLLNADDPKLIIDLRKNNGRISDSKLDPFWDELGKFLEEKSVVHERRQSEVAYMPFALSVGDLKQQVLSRMPPKSAAPSDSWLKLNFYPGNPTTESATNYTGRFQVKHAVQQRLLRAQHIDSEFGFHQYTLLKHFVVKWRDNCLMQCLDDKAIIPVGEPGKPTAATNRRHNAGLVTSTGTGLLSLDHDYHLCGIIPSVCLQVDIPDEPRGSFYHGDVHITVKDKVFEASSPHRHAAETVKIVRNFSSDDSINCSKPILVRYTDGGPDHRTTYSSVQLCAILEFVALDLDMFVAVRTAPNQSYNNPAERVMSLLNLGLQNVSLARGEMIDGHELRMRSLSSLKAIRKCNSKALHDALKASVNEPVKAVKEIFSRLRRSHGNVYVHDSGTEEEMTSLKNLLQLLDPVGDINSKKPFESPGLKQFYSQHCRVRHYTFQVKKCRPAVAHECPYCIHAPPRLAEDVFETLHFLPDPVLGQGGSYKDFNDVYGSVTSDKDRPSLKVKPQATERDKKYSSVFVGGRVRDFIICQECGKRRVVYSKTKLTRYQEAAIQRVQEELLYICGDCLFPGGEFQDQVLVREGISCTSDIETTYYAGVTVSFSEICFFCGDIEISNGPEIQQLKTEFTVVRPICVTCLRSGKTPATRNALKVGQKRKRN